MMKALSLSLIISVLFIVGCGKKSDEATAPAPPGSKFGVKAGMAEMTMEMMGMKTTVVNFWDDFGSKSFTEVQGEMMGSKMHETSIENNGYSFKYDVEKKTGTKVKKGPQMEEMSFYGMTPQQLKERGMTEAGKETFLGHECTVYEVDVDQMGGGDSTGQKVKIKGKVWVWNGIPMKMEMGDMMKMQTTKLEIMDAVPAAKFEVPKDVVITEM